MVLKQRLYKMSSDQPLKKKPKRTETNSTTATSDAIARNFVHNSTEAGVQTNLQALHLSVQADINEDDLTLNSVNLGYDEDKHSSSDSELEKTIDETDNVREITTAAITTSRNSVGIQECGSSSSIPPAPNISISGSLSSIQSNFVLQQHYSNSVVQSSNDFLQTSIISFENDIDSSLDDFQQRLIKHCLCNVSDNVFTKHFQLDANNAIVNLLDLPINELLQFLSDLQLLFDVYLKQNDKGFICPKIIDNCKMVINNNYHLVEQIISIPELENDYVCYMASRVLSSLLIVVKKNVNKDWLAAILLPLVTNHASCKQISFSLDIIKGVVEWKDIEIHVLEEPDPIGAVINNPDCVKVVFEDSESYDTSPIKELIIKSLETNWPDLVNKIRNLILNNTSTDTQTCILTFLRLWEQILSVKANLSVINIKPFYPHLDAFAAMLTSNLPPVIWKQLLSLFNEVLCYGSTLALQDMMPDDTCQLAHLVFRSVKDFRILDTVPYRRNLGNTVNCFVGTIRSTDISQSNIDKTLLQKMILLVLKSIAVTIKETRSDSSDSSVGSDNYDFYQDMQVIERSIKEVLRKVDIFIKNILEFHPATPFCKIMVHLFSDQDNYLIESMVCTLDIVQGVSYGNVISSDLVTTLSPVHTFIEFLKIVSYHSDVLLDYLVSSETCFLLYLLRFLKYVRKHWNDFVASCRMESTSRNDELDSTMGVLLKLKSQINKLVSKNLFPYNINPIIRLLDTCENLYDGNEYS